MRHARCGDDDTRAVARVPVPLALPLPPLLSREDRAGVCCSLSQSIVFIREERRGDGLSLGPRQRSECARSFAAVANFFPQLTHTE